MLHSKFGQLLRRSGGVPWYLSGGIGSQNCLGAWDFKHAASYASSKISLVNPSALNLWTNGVAFPAWANGTGLTFTAANSEYLTIASAIATAVPLSMICRFRSIDVISEYFLMAIVVLGGNDQFGLAANGLAVNDPFSAFMGSGGGGDRASSTSGYTANNWFTACGTFTAGNNWSGYINGGSKGTNVGGPFNPAGINRTMLGATYWGALYEPTEGNISACAFYNIALSDAQVLAIHNAIVAAGL